MGSISTVCMVSQGVCIMRSSLLHYWVKIMGWEVVCFSSKLQNIRHSDLFATAIYLRIYDLAYILDERQCL